MIIISAHLSRRFAKGKSRRPFLRGLFLEGPLFGGAYVRREIGVIKSLRPACSGKEIYHFCFVLFCIRGQIPSTNPPGGLYLEGRFNDYDFGGLIFGGAYTKCYYSGMKTI